MSGYGVFWCFFVAVGGFWSQDNPDNPGQAPWHLPCPSSNVVHTKLLPVCLTLPFAAPTSRTVSTLWCSGQ
ncbi:hypothetical protein PF005_g33791 [Phytophthora fragariae]|uniref:Secreted protein n=1 Tax=Phytophthora fragariae TaxID=53985 RepID=A0A6A3TTM2_9STRA|nr:hypothetical protein PF003_g23648 [Phytophthora fragariae]KAE9141869.1 hypothetical protein PF005_g33791 [Phytophthora fragariae]